MAAQIEVVNQALTALESETLTDVNDPGDAASAVRAMWDLSRRHVLRDTQFNFATTYVQLTEDPSAPSVPSDRMDAMRGFRLPNDCIKAVQVYTDNAEVDWMVSGKWVYAAYETITLMYVYDAPIGLWDASATECLSYYLAAKLAMPITQSAGNRDDMLKLYSITKNNAALAAGLEGSNKKIRSESRLTRVRHSSGAGYYR